MAQDKEACYMNDRPNGRRRERGAHSREELAQNRIVREKYLGSQFELKMKDFQLVDEQKRKRDRERELQE